MSAVNDVLLVVALKTDQPNIARRVQAILAAAEPFAPDTQPLVWAKSVDELVAADLDALVALTNVGPDAVSRLRVGNVVSGGASYSQADRGSGNAPDSPDTDGPQVAPTWNEESA